MDNTHNWERMDEIRRKHDLRREQEIRHPCATLYEAFFLGGLMNYSDKPRNLGSAGAHGYR
jgi:hypothetical protein